MFKNYPTNWQWATYIWSITCIVFQLYRYLAHSRGQEEATRIYPSELEYFDILNSELFGHKCTLPVPEKIFYCYGRILHYHFKLQIKLTYITWPYLTILPSPALTLPGATFPSPKPNKNTFVVLWLIWKVTKIWQNKSRDRQSATFWICLEIFENFLC